MERIFIADGIRRRPGEGMSTADRVTRERKLREVSAYLYSGWEYSGWGSASKDSVMEGMTGFYFERVDDSSGPGFGAKVLLDRLASGLHFGVVVDS